MRNITYQKPKITNVMSAAEPAAIYISLAQADVFSMSQFDALNKKLSFTQQEWADILHVSERTLQRYIKERKPFVGLHAEHLHQLAALADIGLATFADIASFESWLRTPKTVLGKEIGFEALRSFGGVQLIADELGRVAYGVYS